MKNWRSVPDDHRARSRCSVKRDYLKYCRPFAQPRPGYAHAPAKPGRGRRSDAWLDNKIVDVFVWLFQKLFHTRPCWTKCNAAGGKKLPVCGVFVKALFRTR